LTDEIQPTSCKHCVYSCLYPIPEHVPLRAFRFQAIARAVYANPLGCWEVAEPADADPTSTGQPADGSANLLHRLPGGDHTRLEVAAAQIDCGIPFHCQDITQLTIGSRRSSIVLLAHDHVRGVSFVALFGPALSARCRCAAGSRCDQGLLWMRLLTRFHQAARTRRRPTHRAHTKSPVVYQKGWILPFLKHC
jgi:hypothetical protein